MFNIFKKKKKQIDTIAATNFNNVLKVIEDFILFEEFNKASLAINEVIEKENESFKIYIEKVEEKNKKKELENFKKKLEKLYKLKEKNDKKKRKYEIKILQKRKKEEIKFVEKKVIELCWNGNFYEAISLLNNLLEKNINNLQTINFVNKQKKEINKNIEKYKQKKEKEIKKNAFMQAQELIWEIKNNVIIQEKKLQNQNNLNFIQKLKNKLNFYWIFKKRLKDKRLLDEINLLLQTYNEKNDLIAKSKLTQVHSGISKEIYWEKINWFDLYWKIMWADKISGDSLWFHKTKNNNVFFIWDATWHWVRAWFIISQMTKKFHEIVWNEKLEKIVMEINNSLKQELKSWNFITSIFFNINKNSNNTLDFVWMWHQPIFVYRKATWKTEKIISGWLAAWIRIIKEIENVKKKSIIFEDGDILISYTDWIVEAKNEAWKIYWIDRIEKKLEEFAKNTKSSLEDIYKKFIDDLKNWTWWKANYNDDVTIILLKKDKNKDILDKIDKVDEIIEKEWLDKKFKKKIIWKTMEEIKEEIEKLKKENALKGIIKNLDIIYKTWELPKLKQDCIRYIKEWYIHKKINYYLKKALDNENEFKIKQKEKKIQDKYNVLKELYKKWDYETVISECYNIISKDGNI